MKSNSGSYFLVLAFFIKLFLNVGGARAQNTSLNTNNIPIAGSNSVGIGFEALSGNTGGRNVALGHRALASSTSGFVNVGLGAGALQFNTSGSSNTAVGGDALLLNNVGSVNTAIGFDALRLNTEGSFNVGIGALALRSNGLGLKNTAVGSYALTQNRSGELNTAMGYDALISNRNGSRNTSIGDSSGFSSIGSGNIFIGHSAGGLEVGNNKFYIGNEARNTLIYGDMGSGQLLMGKPDVTNFNFTGNRTLNVVGGILTDSVRVALSGLWADYVFDNNYPIMPLDKLADFINQNRHLPGIPTLEEVKLEGIQVAEMQAKLLEKIEELTLHLIGMYRQVTVHQQELEKAKQLIEKLGNLTTQQQAVIEKLLSQKNKRGN